MDVKRLYALALKGNFRECVQELKIGNMDRYYELKREREELLEVVAVLTNKGINPKVNPERMYKNEKRRKVS